MCALFGMNGAITIESLIYVCAENPMHMRRRRGGAKPLAIMHRPHTRSTYATQSQQTQPSSVAISAQAAATTAPYCANRSPAEAMSKRPIHNGAITVTIVPPQQPADKTRVMIEGGSLPRELVWVPDTDIVFQDGAPYLTFNRRSQALSDLCGTPLDGLKWVEDFKEARDDECKRIYKNAINTEGWCTRASKRQMTQTLELPTTVDVDLVSVNGDAFTVKALFTSDFRHLVAFHATNESLSNVVKCIRAHPDKGVRNVTPKRPDRTYVSQFPEVRWSRCMQALFVTWSDSDGMAHRKQRKPWTVRPDDPDEEKALMEKAELWLHGFYTDRHKGPDGFIIPADVCDPSRADAAAMGDELGDEIGDDWPEDDQGHAAEVHQAMEVGAAGPGEAPAGDS
jgi:hypothetical protein